jgi:molybdate transport system substrate-binding protein
MAQLERAGRVRATDRHPLLSNQLAVVLPAGSTRKLQGPGDLASLDRIAIADPRAVPLGLYARSWLEKAGVWPRIAPKVVPTLDARAALSAVEAGNVDAGIVYRTDAALSSKVGIAFEVPRKEGPAIVYPVAVLVGAKPSTRAFIDWLRAEEAWPVFARYGFLRPE